MIILLFVGSTLLAQKRITGTITNKDTNQPVSGATVQVKGTTNATLTRNDGTFEILANDNAVLVITVVGHKSQEISVNARPVINISMETSMNSLEEVVVTGYTAQRKRDLTGAISVVKPDEMTRRLLPLPLINKLKVKRPAFLVRLRQGNRAPQPVFVSGAIQLLHLEEVNHY